MASLDAFFYIILNIQRNPCFLNIFLVEIGFMCQNQTSLVLRVELFSDKKVILDKGKKRFLLIKKIKLASVTKCNLRNWNNFFKY